jgi:hypothetical protein
MSILDKIFEKKGINSFDELTLEERKTYERWTEILDKPKISVSDIQTFLQKEDQRLQQELLDYQNSERKQIFLQASSRLTRMLIAIITAPEQEKKQLQVQIEQMLKQ